MTDLLQRLLGRAHTPAKPIIVVSGLPRSGTSMMMRMLESGGLPILADGARQADADNPRGYFEFERVKRLDKGDDAWLKNAQGKAVKVISELLKHLPARYAYRVVFMSRDLTEVMASQEKMLVRRGERHTDTNDADVAQAFQTHLQQVQAWLRQQPHMSVLEVRYNQVLEDPRAYAVKVRNFIGVDLDVARMAEAVETSLYRNRHRGS